MQLVAGPLNRVTKGGDIDPDRVANSAALPRKIAFLSSDTLRATLGLKRALGFDSLAPLRVFGDSVPEARATLRRQLAKRPGAVERRQWELSRGMVLAPGHSGSGAVNTRSVRGLAAALVAASQPQSIEGALGLLERWVVDRLGGWNVPGLEAL